MSLRSAEIVILLLFVSCHQWVKPEALNLPLDSEISTFNSSHYARYYLQQSPKENLTVLTQVDLKFRTSYSNRSQLFSIKNEITNETLAVELYAADQIKLHLHWLVRLSNSTNETQLVDEEITLQALGIGNGEWHALTLLLGSNWSLVLDSNQTEGRLPDNFTADFTWNNETAIDIAGGSGFRGCIANFTLDEAVSLPLHAQSQLLNQTDYLSILESASNLPEKPECRQASCQCEPNGACIYRQWDVLDRCNCTRGYEPNSFCQTEWNTCESLDPQSLCQNAGNCFNKPGTEEFGCNCTEDYRGSRCQSFDICRLSVTCQNGATCQLTGDVEQSIVDYNCSCTSEFTGRNCTLRIETPNGPDIGLIVGITVGVIAILLLAIVAFVAAKVIRDRRRDSGAYRPSHREAAGTGANRNGTDSLAMGLRPPLDERLI